MPGGCLQSTTGVGCEIVRHEELCVGCGKCATICPSGRLAAQRPFDVNQLLDAPAGSRRARSAPLCGASCATTRTAPSRCRERVTVLRTIGYDDEKCLGCGTCVRGCPAEAIEARPPKARVPAPAPRPREVTRVSDA